MKPGHLVAAILAVLGAFACSDLGRDSQDSREPRGPLQLSGGPTCPECRIALAPVATLGHPDDSASARPDAAVFGCMVGVTADSLFLLSGVVGGGEILVFRRDGRAAFSIGREGQGPGELGSSLLTIVSGDTVFVVDNSNARIVTMDLSGAILGSFRLPERVHSVARLADGRFLLHRRPLGPTQPLFHLVDASGTEVASFGRSQRELWNADQWVLGSGRSADFWAASLWEYEVFRGVGDSLSTAVLRDVDWFPSGVDYSPAFLETEPPPAQITHLYEAEHNLLWVYASVADPEWAPGIPDVGSAEWLRKSFDTMIEVIDLAEGRVLAGYRSDDYLGGVCGSPLVYAVTTTSDGDVRVALFEPHLER